MMVSSLSVFPEEIPGDLTGMPAGARGQIPVARKAGFQPQMNVMHADEEDQDLDG
jgi:hypothetical protein